MEIDADLIRTAIRESYPSISQSISIAVIDGLIQGLKESKRDSISINELELFKQKILVNISSKEEGSK